MGRAFTEARTSRSSPTKFRWVIIGPAVVKHPKRVGMLGSSLDVSPTILGLIGRPYETMFFGRDLLQDPPGWKTVRCSITTATSVCYDHSRMVVLGLRQAVDFYEGDPKLVDMQRISNPTPGTRHGTRQHRVIPGGRRSLHAPALPS